MFPERAVPTTQVCRGNSHLKLSEYVWEPALNSTASVALFRNFCSSCGLFTSTVKSYSSSGCGGTTSVTIQHLTKKHSCCNGKDRWLRAFMSSHKGFITFSLGLQQHPSVDTAGSALSNDKS